MYNYERAGVHAGMHAAGVPTCELCGICQCTELCDNLYCFSVYENICLFKKQASLLAIISKFGAGVENSILWLSFAQQKCHIHFPAILKR
jgi:hypothetical protein